MQFPPSSIRVSNANNAESDAEHGHAASHPYGPGVDGQPSTQPASDAVILDPEKLPTWQRAFILGPNVRFTRTPGQNYAKREADDDVAPAHAADIVAPARQSAAEAEASTVTAAGYVLGRSNSAFKAAGQATGSPVGALQQQIVRALSDAEKRTSDPQPGAVDLQPATPKLVLPPRTGAPLRVPPRPLREPLSNRPVEPIVRPPQGMEARAAVATTTVHHEAQARAVPTQPSTVGVTSRSAIPASNGAPARSFAAIPDHLIWEMMSLGASEVAGVRPMPGMSHVAQGAVSATRSEPQPVASQAPMSPVEACDMPTIAAASVPVVPPPVAQSSVASASVAPMRVFSPESDEAPSAVHLYRQVELVRPVRVMAPEPVPTVLAPRATDEATVAQPVVSAEAPSMRLAAKRAPGLLSFIQTEDYLFPSVDLLQAADHRQTGVMSPEALEQSAGLLESILEDFGVKGEIIDVRPGPVVTLYEFEPAPGVKSSRVINLADDIARSMSALSARVAVVPGRNVIGIELPNIERETVYLRELIESSSYVGTDYRLPLCLGKTIGGEPVIAELAKMPHLLVAGTTGSGKSVAINTMILSLIYHLRPEECRLIMVDPKMLELSVYDGIPHLLTPVVTDPKKAVLALKWAVREMEERYRKMSRLGVRNIDGFNARVAEARAKGETIMLSVPNGFDRATGEQTFEDQQLDLAALPYIVVIVDEMADLMMVAGKEIEGAIQRLAQMARAAGIHLVMATQRPSVDVITGTIKANFPTRVSFQVTSKIDSRTILGEQGAEHLLGQGDMLHMVGGGRIARVHGPFVSDFEVEKVVAHLKTQGQPAYLGSVTEDTEDAGAEDAEDAAVFDNTAMGAEDEGDDLFERAVKIVQRDKKCSTSYIQRRLSIGYNRAASLVERMEQEGLVGAPNHVGKREILGQGLQGGKDSEG
ncbi:MULTISPECIES: DNA translocase FtsK [Alphaproteobacteria]|nr:MULTISPECIES: DNA translocase FtsK [Alphaproteobacteria]